MSRHCIECGAEARALVHNIELDQMLPYCRKHAVEQYILILKADEQERELKNADAETGLVLGTGASV